MELLEKLGTRKSKRSYGVFVCSCCGSTVERELTAGKKQKTCGCQRSVIHGYARNKTTLLYFVWAAMRRRCSKPTHKGFHRYGGRGIKICEEWQDVGIFIDWALANGWQQALQIDRINNDGDYEPTNCRFVTLTANSHNRSTTKLSNESVVEIRRIGQSGILSQNELSKMFGVCRATICMVLKGHIWKGIT